jgi:HD-GYP domain-containing protein (c-di-GMP phosphodiesterase class II)
MARAMGLPEEDINEIALAALLHDIGKIGVSDAVLKKPGALDRDEWIEMQSHCEIGHRILNAIPGAERIREMVYAHHERPDGKGYPRGLAKADIPIGARIICVADAFDSMTANRVYRAAMDPQVALREIARLRGEQFDADAVDAICELMLYVPEADTDAADGTVTKLQMPAKRYEGRDRSADDGHEEADDVAAA